MISKDYVVVFSSPGRSPGRAIVLPPASALASVAVSALAKSLMLKFFMLLQARCNEKDLKVKPATSFKYFQYLLTKKLKQSSRQRKYNLTLP